MERQLKYMLEAVELSRKGLSGLEGGPFGCVIVRGDEVVGRGWNQVTSTNDPTAHAEVVAIRNACLNLGSHQLTGCEVYASCEPCPMCLGALYWARPDRIYFGNTRDDAAGIGFDDSLIYNELNANIADRRIQMIRLGSGEALEVFKEWQNSEHRKHY